MVASIDGGALQAATSCFTAAYARCAPATLGFVVPGTDAGTKYAFVIVPGLGEHGACAIADQWSTFGPDSGDRSGRFTCQGLTTAQDPQHGGTELIVQGCGSAGDIHVPWLFS